MAREQRTNARRLAIGVAVGGALAAGSIAAIESATPDAEAQASSGAVTKADVDAANGRAIAAIKISKRIWNLLGIYGADPGELVGKNSDPVVQQRGLGAGLPEEALSQAVRDKLNSAGGAGPAGAAGPAGPAGAAGPQGPPGPVRAHHREFVRFLAEDTNDQEIITLGLPAGSYSAVASVSGSISPETPGSGGVVRCRLSTPGVTGVNGIGRTPGDELETTYGMTPRLAFSSAAPVTLSLVCDTGDSEGFAAGSISATAVSELTIEPPIIDPVA